MIVPFSHMAGFMISAYKPLYMSLFDKDLTFTFEDYVKCQIHMPMLLDLYERDIYLFSEASKFLKGDDRYVDSCGEVLKLFYKDMLDMLVRVIKVHPDIQHKIDIVVNFNRDTLFPTKRYSLEDAKEEMRKILTFEKDDWDSGLGAGVIIRFSESEAKTLEANNTLALASILTDVLHSESDPVILEVS